jgi:hypothetical protein
MAFTPVTVTGSYESESGATAAGTVTFTLTQAMQNADQIVTPTPITVTLDGTGHFSTVLLANDDTGTTPPGVCYGVTEQITGGQQRDYFIVVSHATSPVDLSTLMPQQPGWE